MLPPVTLNTTTRNGSRPSAGPVAPDAAAPGVEPGSEPVRLEFAPVFGLGAVDGAWWPRSLDAANELLPLLAALAPQIGRPTRVSLNTTAWDPGPRQVWAAGHGVHLGWFTHMDRAVVTVAHERPAPGSGGRRFQDRVRLLVIPPQTSPQQARAVMSRTASGTASGTPADLLATEAPATG
jgi:hypothetical protein